MDHFTRQRSEERFDETGQLFALLSALGETPLYCPQHQYHVAELFCDDVSCKVEWKVMCTTCHSYGVHQGHNYKTLDKIYEDKLDKTRGLIKKLKSEIEKVGNQPAHFENDPEYISEKNELDRKYQKDLDILKQRANRKINEKQEELHTFNTQLSELCIFEQKLLNIKSQRNPDIFRNMANTGNNNIKKNERKTVRFAEDIIGIPAKKPDVEPVKSHQLENLEEPTVQASVNRTNERRKFVILSLGRLQTIQMTTFRKKLKFAGTQIDNDTYLYKDEEGHLCSISFWNFIVAAQKPVIEDSVLVLYDVDQVEQYAETILKHQGRQNTLIIASRNSGEIDSPDVRRLSMIHSRTFFGDRESFSFFRDVINENYDVSRSFVRDPYY